MAFVPDPLLGYFHAVPRLLPRGGSTSNFIGRVALDSDYFGAIFLQLGALAAWGVLAFLVFSIAYIGAVTCCRRSSPPTSCCCLCRRTCFGLLSIGMLGPLIAALALFASWRTGVDDAISAAQRLSNVISGAASTVNFGLVPAETQLQAIAASLAQNAASAPDPLPTLTAAFSTSVSAALATTTALGASLSDADSFFTRELNLAGNWSGKVPRVNVDEVKNGLSTGVWALLGVSLGWLLVMMTTLTPTRTSAACFRCTSPIAIALGGALPALAGVLYAIALVGSDFCAASAASAGALLNYTNAPAFAANTLVFYATCVPGAPGAPGGTPPEGATAAIAALTDALNVVAALNTSAALVNVTSLQGLLGDATYSIGVANASAAALLGAVQCAPVQALWLGILTPACNTALVGVARTALLAIPSAIAITLLLCFGASICRFHAGDGGGSDAGAEGGLEGARFGYKGRRASEAVEWGATAKYAPKYTTTQYEKGYGTYS